MNLPLSPEVLQNESLYWLIHNQHALKPHGGNIWTLEVSMSYFLSVDLHGGTKIYDLKKAKNRQKDARYGTNQFTLYYWNQDRDQCCACHFTIQVIEALHSEQENQNYCWHCP